MLNTLLATKLNIPQLRKSLVARPKLIKKLNAGLDGRLTLVSAPAGFGKTTLVNVWLHQISDSSERWQFEHCTWISLDEHDNVPSRFLQYLIAAPKIVYPKFGAELQAILENSPNPNLSDISQDFLNELTQNTQPVIIVLDDYHEIQNESIHQILQMMVDRLPPHIHFVITTRQDPPFSLPRWRARGWLNTISSADLRFDQSETGDFLQHTMHLDISPEAVALLEDRTEGWVAGLQLAALSLADTDFSPDTIQEFGGRDRYVTEYLLTEVLDHQPAEVQQFLLPTSILDRFNTNLCTAILHSSASEGDLGLTQKYQEIIETLERSNLFIIPLDREEYWFRYHHLFAQLLRQRLQRTLPPEKIDALYRRAALWFVDHGLIEEAVNYALQGKDYAFTAHLITSFEADSLWNQNWGLQLRKWGAELPSDVLQEFPKAALYIALAHMTRTEIKESIHYIGLVRDDPRVKAEILLIDAIFTRNDGNIAQALRLATQAAERFESRDKPMYVAAQIQIVICLMTLGDLAAAEDLAASVRQEIRAESDQFFNVYIQLIQILGIIKEQRGKLLEAERLYLEGIAIIQQSGKVVPLVGLLQARLGAIYFQWDEIEKAEEYCDMGLVWGERTGIGDIITHVAFVQISIAISRQDKSAVEASVEKLLVPRDWPEFMDMTSIIEANQAFINVRLGDLSSAVRWADSCGWSLNDHPSLQYRSEYQTLVRVRYEEYRQLGIKDGISKLIAFLDQFIQLATEKENVGLAIDCWILKALSFELLDHNKNAVTALHTALDLGFPGGFVHSFLDFGVPVRDLLQKSLVYEPHKVYKRRLLLVFADEGIAPSTSVSSDHTAMITLTPREFEILQLIATGLSNKAIQESLMLSKNTVRTHIKNLYSKLGVNSRTQAVQQARENGLI